MYNNTTCPVCGNTSFTPFLEVKDYTVSQEIFTVVSCESCDFKFTNPRPEDAQLGRYYQSEDYISHSETRKGIVSKLYHAVRKRTLRAKLDLVASYVSRGAILDYGSGTGSFIQVCQEAGWNAFGVEPDKGARKKAFELGLNVSENREILDKKISDLRFNAITLWHVLEHVTDLNETIHFFKSRLTREGVLIIAVPNHRSFDAQFYAEHWAAYDVPRHLYHFERKTISRLLERNGFKLVSTHPMKFDSYYVSLLSEKYRHNKNRMFAAFLTGLKSNFKARSSGEYSSLIYVFRAE